MASLADLPAVLERALDLFSSQLLGQGVEIPERRYVQAGSMPVWDGEQMTVGLMGIAQGQPGHGYAGTFIPEALNLYATLFVLVIRPVASIQDDGTAEMEIPTAQEQDEDGKSLAADAQALVLAASNIHRASMTGQGLTGPGEGFSIDGLQPLGPEGGMAGNRLLLSISLS